MKTQNIRLVDVFVLGPFMVHLAQKSSMTRNERVLLALAGIATILYNGANYLEVRKAEDAAA